jgi:hypothetical protein
VVGLSFVVFEATAPADGVWMPSEGQMYAMLIGTPAFIAAAVCWVALGIRTIFRALRST